MQVKYEYLGEDHQYHECDGVDAERLHKFGIKVRPIKENHYLNQSETIVNMVAKTFSNYGHANIKTILLQIRNQLDTISPKLKDLFMDQCGLEENKLVHLIIDKQGLDRRYLCGISPSSDYIRGSTGESWITCPECQVARIIEIAKEMRCCTEHDILPAYADRILVLFGQPNE